MTINIGGGELKELKPRILVMGVGGAGGGVCCIFLISVVILLFFYFALNVTQLRGTKIAAKMNVKKLFSIFII